VVVEVVLGVIGSMVMVPTSNGQQT